MSNPTIQPQIEEPNQVAKDVESEDSDWPVEAAVNSPAEDPVLTTYRRSIDNIDAALIHMLAERFRITQAVGEYKAKSRLAPADPGREQRQIQRLRKLALEADLDPEFSEKFIRFVIEEVIRHHQLARGE